MEYTTFKGVMKYLKNPDLDSKNLPRFPELWVGTRVGSGQELSPRDEIENELRELDRVEISIPSRNWQP